MGILLTRDTLRLRATYCCRKHIHLLRGHTLFLVLTLLNLLVTLQVATLLQSTLTRMCTKVAELRGSNALYHMPIMLSLAGRMGK